ncbi:MAG TPA: PEP-CTERM sorting domain-containing protein [Candidatus Baltobacteraceae bacterium]|nr:PEP-CTERM sorting domain-containing protein [Candidatus Baltobacteraceae bacterium]
MNLSKRLLGSIAVLFFLALPAWAGRIDVGGSNYGLAPNDPNDGSPVPGSASALSSCEANIGTSSNCEAFNTTSFSIPVNGTSTSITGAVFAFDEGDGTGETIDVYELPFTVSAGTSVSLTFTNLTDNFGAFACNNGSNGFAVDSLENTMEGLPCTTGSASGLSGFYTESESGDTATFTFLAGAPSSWAFYSDVADPLVSIATSSGTVPAPEPGTLALLALGLIGVAVTRRRQAVRL